MLSTRQGVILKSIVGEYISHAAPVASQSIAARSGLRLSPATIRHEMAELAGDGYIHRVHVSSGGVPSDKGYRYYVEDLPAHPTLRKGEMEEVRRRYHEIAQDVELWRRLTAEILAELVQNVAVVSVPRAQRTRITRLELVLLQETAALLVLILRDAKTRQRILRLTQGVTQEELTRVANELSAVYGGSTLEAIALAEVAQRPLERQVAEAAQDLLGAEETGGLEEPEITGVRYLMDQPEFARGLSVRGLLDVLEDRYGLSALLSRLLAGGRLRVIIGAEHDAAEMHQCSVVVGRYGLPGGVQGYLAVLGPTRMEYQRVIAAVRLLSEAMSGLVIALN